MQIDWSIETSDVKTILQLKKTLTLSQVPDCFSIVANKLADLQGTFTDGFANNITYLLNQQNWQSDNCPNGKPQVALIQQMSEYAFDLYCLPVINQVPQAVVKDFHPDSGFKQFNPAVAGPIVRIAKIADLMELFIRCPDEADLALLKYAHMMIEQIVALLQKRLEVVLIKGSSIKDLVTDVQQQIVSNKMT